MMVINRDEPDQLGPPRSPVRAAQYVRMSTERQQYPIDKQVEIVRTYADEDKSGRNIGARPALERLLRDAETVQADFAVLRIPTPQ